MRTLILAGGAATLAAYIALAITQAKLGSPLFFAIVAVPCAVYGLLAKHLLAADAPPASQAPLDKLLLIALLLAAAFRTPLLSGQWMRGAT